MIKTIRRVHFYLGVFFAPTIIFFAFSGAMQTFSLHEEHSGKPGIPWVAALAELHKNQRVPETWTESEKAPAKAETETPGVPRTAAGTEKASVGSASKVNAAAGAESPAPKRRPKSLPLKTFVGFMSIGLIFSSLLGIYMAFKYSRGAGLIWGLLIAGAALPVLLLYL